MENNTVTAMIDLKKLYVAKLLQDDEKGIKFDTPKYLPAVKEISVKPKITPDEFYAEGIIWQQEQTLQNITVEINIADLSDEDEAMLLGHTIDKETGGVVYSENDKAPEVAILFQAIKGNHKSRFVILYRGIFTLSNEDFKDKEGKANFQSKKLKATFAPLKFNGQWKFRIDEEKDMTADRFFKSVIVSGALEPAPMINIKLADGETK